MRLPLDDKLVIKREEHLAYCLNLADQIWDILDQLNDKLQVLSDRENVKKAMDLALDLRRLLRELIISKCYEL